MVIAVSFLSGALFIIVAIFLFVKFKPSMNNDAYYKRHLDIVEAQLMAFNERVVEERRLANALETIVAQITHTNSAMEAMYRLVDVDQSAESPEEYVRKAAPVIQGWSDTRHQ